MPFSGDRELSRANSFLAFRTYRRPISRGVDVGSTDYTDRFGGKAYLGAVIYRHGLLGSIILSLGRVYSFIFGVSHVVSSRYRP